MMARTMMSIARAGASVTVPFFMAFHLVFIRIGLRFMPDINLGFFLAVYPNILLVRSDW